MKFNVNFQATEIAFQSHLYGIERSSRMVSGVVYTGFNRTFMELKAVTDTLRIPVPVVSIAPLWN